MTQHPANSALLVMDVQRTIVDRFPAPEYLPRLAGAVEAARAAGIPVIYVVVGFRAGHPEISPRNKTFGALRLSGAFTDTDPGTQVSDEVAPKDGEPVVTKKRVSAFAGSDLALVLRAGGIEHLVLTGIATSGVVLSTLREAADLDFGLTVLADGCLDADPEVHRVLTEKVFPRQAEVLDIEAWVTSLGM
ncbi:nicotinamidase-related amidase [Kitasatospora sp. GAS204A]|uniref:cysteine hydrolase family protein n=1 Tax=unclassified Kitasatospora TaxID=2633591 RepID=UPI0024761665|nr:isochorismatase family cysteine hydrolase [Kitasatospora sp. GAS204B]MDH6119056.1 nicotinamidase-related amidase [Kitasatospora sp. GAS204B]